MYHEKLVCIRMTEQLIEKIEDVVEDDKFELYDSISHFIRCACIEKLRRDYPLIKK